MGYLTSARENVRPRLLKKVEESYSTVASIQRFLGVTPERPRGRTPLTVYFKLATELGNEVGFVLLLPALAWLGSGALCSHVCCLFSITFHCGQFLKEYLQLPRPTAPVIRIGHVHPLEFGFPSTHAMASASIPFFLFSVAYTAGVVGAWAALLPLLWWASVTISRLYLGVHSMPDVYAGSFLGFTIMALYVFFDGPGRLDLWMVTSQLWAVELWGTAIFLVSVHPRLDKWSPSYGETAIFLSVTCGVVTARMCGMDLLPLPSTPYQAGIPLASVQGLAIAAKRMLIGYPLVGAIKVLMSKVCTWLVVSVLPQSDVGPKERYAVEIPVKMMTYSMMGYGALVVVPMVFAALGV